MNNTATLKLKPTSPLEHNDVQQRLEKKLNVVNSLQNLFHFTKEMIPAFKDKSHKSKKKKKKSEMLTTILKSIDTFVFIATTSFCLTFSNTGIGLIVISISTGTACVLQIRNKVI